MKITLYLNEKLIMNIFSFVLTALFTVTIASSSASSQPIISIKSFTEVNFDTFDQDTLVLFDIDETLTQYNDAFLSNLQTLQAKFFIAEIIIKYFKVLALKSLFSDQKLFDQLTAIILTKGSKSLIEKNIIHQIQTLQERGTSVLAISKMPTGSLITEKRLEVWRYEYLKNLGFEGSWNDEEHSFTGLKGKPTFYKGILATDKTKKGPTLGAFLQWKQLKPKKVIMFDDHRAPLESVQKECKRRGIQFQGYLFKGATIQKYDKDLAEFQIIHLIEKKEWLNDTDAFKLYMKTIVNKCS